MAKDEFRRRRIAIAQLGRTRWWDGHDRILACEGHERTGHQMRSYLELSRIRRDKSSQVQAYFLQGCHHSQLRAQSCLPLKMIKSLSVESPSASCFNGLTMHPDHRARLRDDSGTARSARILYPRPSTRPVAHVSGRKGGRMGTIQGAPANGCRPKGHKASSL